jgi:hypothetical protein
MVFWFLKTLAAPKNLIRESNILPIEKMNEKKLDFRKNK